MPRVFTKIKNKIRGRRTPQVSAAPQPPAPDPQNAPTTTAPDPQNAATTTAPDPQNAPTTTAPDPQNAAPQPPAPDPQNAPAPADANQQTPPPPPDRLLPEEKRRLTKRKNSFFQGFLNKVGGMTLTAADKNSGRPEALGKKGKAKMGWAIVDWIGDQASGAMGISTNEGYGAKSGTTGVTWVDAVESAIRTLVNAGRSIKHIVEYTKTNGHKDFAEFRGVVKEGIDTLLNLMGAVNGILGNFKSLAEQVPIIGAITGAVSAGMSFAQNLHSLIKVSKSKDRMRDQKEAAKKRIKENQGSANYVEMRHSKADPLKLGKESLHFNPEAIPRRRWIARKKRLDEVTTEGRARLQTSGQQQGGAQQNAAAQTAAEDPLLDALEDYDMVKELTAANKHRQRQDILNIVFGDAVSFGASLASLDPTVGALVGNSIRLAVGVGNGVKAAATFLRTQGRNRGWSGFDENKSDANKLQRRHTLAVNFFQRLQDLSKEKITDVSPDTTEVDEVAKARQGLEKYRIMSNRVDALGVGYGPLMRAQTTRQVLETIRSGFYREGK